MKAAHLGCVLTTALLLTCTTALARGSQYEDPEYRDSQYQDSQDEAADDQDSQYQAPLDDAVTSPDTRYAPQHTPSEVHGTLKAKAADASFRFCNDPNYVLYTHERPYCSFATTAQEVCPELLTACARPEADDRDDFGMSGSFGQSGKKRGGKMRPEGEDEPPEDEPTTLTLPAALVGLFRVVFWLLVAALVLAIAYLLVGAWTKSARDKKDEDDADDPGSAEPREPSLRPRVVESDVARLLARAKAQAQQGRHDAAVDDLYAALLRHLEGEQLLVLQRHRTNGDYVRALREHPAWQGLLRECGRDVERAQFGKRGADATTFERLLSRIEPVLSHALVLLFLALTCLTQQSCSGGDDSSGHHKPWGVLGDTSPRGLALFRSLLEDDGYTVRHRIRKASALDDETGMLVVYDDTSLEDEDWQALQRWVQRGHELWLLGDPEAAEYFGGKGAETNCAPPIELDVAFPGERTVTDDDGTIRPLELTSISGTLAEQGDLVPLVSCAGGPMVSQRTLGDGVVTFFPDLTPLSNASLVSADNAIFVMSLVRAWPQTVEFAGGLTGAGADSPYEALLNAKLGPVLLQIALLMLMLYLARGIPFATLRDPPETGRRRFLDHLTALGRVFQRAGARQHALHHYSAWALGKLNDRVRPGQRMSIIELGALLAKRTGRPQSEVIETLAEAATARNQPEGPVSGDELKIQRRLEALVIETGGNK